MNNLADTSQIHALAWELDGAARDARAIPQISLRHSLSVEDAYRVQQAAIQRRIGRGEQVIGVKMGFTSPAKMAQMGVADQIIGTLTDGMQVANGASISLDAFIHPRCEPEIAFLLRKDLSAELTLEDAFEAIEAVAPAIEIIDSRYEQFRFSLSDVIADNASSAALVLGDWVKPGAHLADAEVTLAVNAKIRQHGSTRDILGNPMRALISAARLAALAGRPLQSGAIVLAGAATAAEPLVPGMRIQATVEHIGDVHFSVLPK
jgi:2-oxo-3-hexenedioate decarboxylase